MFLLLLLLFLENAWNVEKYIYIYYFYFPYTKSF